MLRALMDRLNPPGPAEIYRREARARLKEQNVRHPSADVVELGALSLFERQLATLPKTALTTRGKTRPIQSENLARSAEYSSKLAATLGVTGPFAPAILSTLADFKPERLWKNGAQGRILGGLEAMSQSQQVLTQENHSFVVGDRTIQVTGVTDPQELANLEAAVRKLHQKLPKAVHLLETIHLRPFLGYIPGTHANVQGIAGTKSGHLAIENLVARTEEGAEGTLYHELGHLLDRYLGTLLKARSAEGDTPFTSQEETVSAYARTSPAEDLAETHKLLLQSLDQVLANPDLVHACGTIGKKLAWILEEGYQQPIPGPSDRLKEIQENGPFGWQTPNGVIGAREDLAHTALQLLKQGYPEDERQEWLAKRLAGESVEPMQPRTLEGFHQLLKRAADARHEMRTGDNYAGERALMKGAQRNLEHQLRSGGPALEQAVRAYLEQNEPRHTGVWQQFSIVSKNIK